MATIMPPTLNEGEWFEVQVLHSVLQLQWHILSHVLEHYTTKFLVSCYHHVSAPRFFLDATFWLVKGLPLS